jgi:hypothetical protein
MGLDPRRKLHIAVSGVVTCRPVAASHKPLDRRAPLGEAEFVRT